MFQLLAQRRQKAGKLSLKPDEKTGRTSKTLALADAHRLLDVAIGLDQAHQQLAVAMRLAGLGDQVVDVPVSDHVLNDDDFD